MHTTDPADPTTINWKFRQSIATIPFEVIAGRPINPVQTELGTGLGGFWRWGESLMADAFVVSLPDDGHRYILMIKRGDGHGWAIPGGKVEPGESPVEAAVRELKEETGLDLTTASWSRGQAVYVPDPRATREAWAVTVPSVTYLHDMPTVKGSDDAAEAAWMRADDIVDLMESVAAWDGFLFAAHTNLIADIIGSK